MLFNSLSFAVFLPLVFLLYWSIPRERYRIQNVVLLVSSYIFYSWWDWRFCSLIFASSLVDYVVGYLLNRTDKNKNRKFLLWFSLGFNLGLLGIFKYYNFFIESFVELLHIFGISSDIHSLRIILPLGISFYTFQTLSYTIDLYHRRIQFTADPLAFFTFVSFFPQLVAGPIERAKSLLPQLQEPRQFDIDVAKDGLRQILWGLFKKMVIADYLGQFVDRIYDNYEYYNSPILIFGTIFFTFQIYCDFSGYSDIAIGTGKLFGIRLKQNFRYPYFSRDIPEYWRRWHISMSTWFRDYVYIPLGGNRKGRVRHILNILITFTLGGLWHGAQWKFVIWGFLNGFLYIPFLITGKNKVHRASVGSKRLLPNGSEIVAIVTVFLLTNFVRVFFRADSASHAMSYLYHVFSNQWIFPTSHTKPLLMVLLLLGVEWLNRDREYTLQVSHLPVWLRWLIYYFLITFIFFKGNFGYVPFIYFQF